DERRWVVAVEAQPGEAIGIPTGSAGNHVERRQRDTPQPLVAARGQRRLQALHLDGLRSVGDRAHLLQGGAERVGGQLIGSGQAREQGAQFVGRQREGG